jgi:hypothetical protein
MRNVQMFHAGSGQGTHSQISHRCDACLILFSGSLHSIALMPIFIYRTLYCRKPPKCTMYIQRIHKQKKGHTSITHPKGNIPQLLSLRPQLSNPTPPVTRHEILKIEGTDGLKS